MKNVILLVLISATSIYGQIKWSIMPNVSLIEQRTENTPAVKSGSFINGWQVGIHARIYKKYFYLNPGINFAYVDLVGSPRIEILQGKPANYSLSLPVQLGYDVFRNEDFKFRIAAGGILSYLFKVDKNNLNITRDDYYPIHGGFLFGGGLDFYPICFDINYEFGLSSFFKNPDYKVGVYNFTLGIIID